MVGLKKLLSAGLLVFVAVSVLFLVVGEQDPNKGNASLEDRKSSVCREGENCNGDQAAKLGDTATTIAYYFHRTNRCRTCRALESNAREAIERSLGDELSTGRLSVQARNVEETDNRHFIEKYQITGPSLVLSRIEEGKEVTWKNLDRIWQLIHTPAEYQAYVADEIKSFMQGQS